MITKKTEMEKVVPSLKLKTSELYFKWFSESDKSDAIKEIVQLIKSGKVTRANEVLTYNKVFIF